MSRRILALSYTLVIAALISSLAFASEVRLVTQPDVSWGKISENTTSAGGHVGAKIPRYFSTSGWDDDLDLYAKSLTGDNTGTISGYTEILGAVDVRAYASVSTAIDAAMGKMLLFPAGTYSVSSTITKTFTGKQHWIAAGPVTIQYTGTSAAYLMQLELDGNDFIIEGPFTFDANSLAGTALRVNNDESSMATAANLFISKSKFINAYSDTNSRNAMGFYSYGAFNLITLDRCEAHDISRAAGLTGTPASIGLGYGHGGITNYARKVSVIDPVIDNVTSANAVASGDYINMDGINVSGPAADANGGIKIDTVLDVRGGIFRYADGHSIKSQMESNTIIGPTFVRGGTGKKSMESNREVDFQYGSGVLRDCKTRYTVLSDNTTPFPLSLAVAGATSRGFATEEGHFVVEGCEITNDVPQGTDILPYFVNIDVIGGSFQSVHINNNGFLGAGSVDQVININDNVGLISAVGNYINDIGSSLIYSGVDYSGTNVFASGNRLNGTSKNIVSGDSTIPIWYGKGNTGFGASNSAERKAATASVADNGAITHYMGTTPTGVVCSPSIDNEVCTVTALGATTFTVGLKKTDGTTGTTQTVYWWAWK